MNKRIVCLIFTITLLIFTGCSLFAKNDEIEVISDDFIIDEESDYTEPQIEEEIINFEIPTHLPENSPFRRARELAALTVNEDGVDNEWALWLVNAWNPLPEGYNPELSLIGTYQGDERRFDSRASEYALLMMEAVHNDGIILRIVSSYRSVERQTINFENYFNSSMNWANSKEEAFTYVSSQIAIPRTSEHNLALAIDFNLIEENFDQTEEFRWLQDNSWKYGFILRYPKGTTHITGIIYEPWHYRFVGLYHAEKIFNLGLTLEEYMEDDCAGDNTVVEAFRTYILEG
ncbi:MAG: M15 family metallopeptidase [Oscillospiraceae bacterium]|nr:M15 family metallopeptidase [Oscillospiraceae bacterium]